MQYYFVILNAASLEIKIVSCFSSNTIIITCLLYLSIVYTFYTLTLLCRAISYSFAQTFCLGNVSAALY